MSNHMLVIAQINHLFLDTTTQQQSWYGQECDESWFNLHSIVHDH